ncbi:18491_t:CDS:2, partial [Racocetra fulgida]
LKSEFGKDSNLTLAEDDFDEEYSSDSSNGESEAVRGLETHDVQSVIAQVKQAIYNSLWKYWGDPKYAGLLATLLDPRLKKMHVFSNYLKNEAIRICREELDKITIDAAPIQSTASS